MRKDLRPHRTGSSDGLREGMLVPDPALTYTGKKFGIALLGQYGLTRRSHHSKFA